MCSGSYGSPSSSAAPSQPCFGSEASGTVSVAERVTSQSGSDGWSVSTAASSASQPSISGSDSASCATPQCRSDCDTIGFVYDVV